MNKKQMRAMIEAIKKEDEKRKRMKDRVRQHNFMEHMKDCIGCQMRFRLARGENPEDLDKELRHSNDKTLQAAMREHGAEPSNHMVH